MERTIERYSNGSSTTLRLTDQEKTLSDHIYEIKMINANQPAGLLPMHIYQENGQVLYDYDISGLKSLKDSEGDEVQVDYLYSLITAMAREAEILAEFMLDPQKLMLAPETIFFKQWSGEVFFCYDPGKTESLKESLQRLMEYFLKKLDPKEEEDVLFMYGLYQRTREPMVTLASLNEFFLENREKYLKIGEEREKKQKAAEEISESSYMEAIAENSIYEELGLEKPQRATTFPFLKKSKENPAALPQEMEGSADRPRMPNGKRKTARESLASEEAETSLELDSFRDRRRVKETEGDGLPETEAVPKIKDIPEQKNRKRKQMKMMTPEEEADASDEWEPGKGRQIPEPASKRKDLDPRAIFGRLRPYSFELAVGGVVLAGVILFIVT